MMNLFKKNNPETTDASAQKLEKEGRAPETGASAEQKAASLRVLKSGAYASALAAVMLVVVILVNLVANALPTKYTQIDISDSGLFTLSDTTKSMMDSLTQDVKAYYLCETGSEDVNIVHILNSYAQAGKHFSWEQRDPAIYPTFAAQHNADTASAGSVLLVCGENSVVEDYYNDLYTADYSNYSSTGSYSVNFSAESALTQGIAKVSRTTSYVAYALTGHGEAALPADYTATLENSGVTMQDLNLLTTGSVPSDAAAVILNAPTADLDSASRKALQTYLAGGGKLLVATAVGVETPNLDALLAEYGLSRQEGLVVENDANYCYYNYATYLLPEVSANDVTSGITSGMYVLLPVAQGILTDDTKADITFTPLLTTTASSYSMQGYATAETAQQASDDPNGPFDIGMAAESTATGAKVVWVNCGNAFVDDTNQVTSGGNAQLLGSVANWMNGEENTVAIDAKSLSGETLNIPALSGLSLAFVFVILIPLALLVVGIVLFSIRRRR